MEIRNAAHIAASIDQVWASVTGDVEGIVPCIPGATLTSRLAQDRYAGEFRVKVGPMGLTLDGQVTVAEVNAAERRMRMHVSGRDRRGLGQADANVDLTLAGDEVATDVEIVADATLSGPVAQFGRPAIITAIGSRILGEFARCLEARFAAPADAGRAPTQGPSPTPGSDRPSDAGEDSRKGGTGAVARLAPPIGASSGIAGT